jgi:hypothetical protein
MKPNQIIAGSFKLLAGLALGLAVSASAQSAADSPTPAAPPSPPPAVTDTGLLGTNYLEADFGFQKEAVATPDVLHDYGLVYNQSLVRQGAWGTDLNLTYDYLTGSAFGVHDDRDQAEAGFTEYVAQNWGVPFLTADAGGAWQNADHVARKSLAYSFTGGVQFEVLPNLFLAPFTAYQAEPYLYNHEIPHASYPDRDWVYGVKLTCRLTPQWSISLKANGDQYSPNDLGFGAGVSRGF